MIKIATPDPATACNVRERAETQRLLFHWAKRAGEPGLWPLLRKHGRIPWFAAMDRILDGFNRAFEEDPELFDAMQAQFVKMIRAGNVYYRKMHSCERSEC